MAINFNNNSTHQINFNITLSYPDKSTSIETVNEQIRNNYLKDRLLDLDYQQIPNLFSQIWAFYNNNDKKRLNQFFIQIEPKLKDNLYHLKGKLISLTHQLYHQSKDIEEIINEIYFTSILNVTNGFFTYKIYANGIRKGLKDKLDKISKNAMIYITNLKAKLEKGESGTIFVFYLTCKSKIYLELPALSDNQTALNNTNTNNSIKSNYLIDITKKNELEYMESIDDNMLNKIIKKTKKEEVDFSSILNIPMENDTFSLNVNNIGRNNLNKIVSIYGIVTNIVIHDNASSTIEITSFVDCNSIKAHIFNCKALYSDLKVNMVVYFQDYLVKINCQLEIILKNTIQSRNTYLGFIPMENMAKILRNRAQSRNYHFESFISLTTSNVLKRTLGKYCIIVKELFKVKVFYETMSYKIKGFPGMRLSAKFLVDDGTYEVFIFVEDDCLINMLEITEEKLQLISKAYTGLGELIIYDKYKNCGYLTNNSLIKIFRNQFIIYATPFANMTNNKTGKGEYFNYFENILDLTTKKESIGFINGGIIKDKYLLNSKSEYFLKRPYLKVTRVETVEHQEL